MSQPVLLITGSSSGIGLATAVAAAGSGYRVVATLRNPASDGPLRAAAAEAGVELEVRTLDVTDEAAIRSTVDGVVADFGRLDAVVNNAGAGYIGTIEQIPVDDVRRVMEVNFFGVVAVTGAVMSHLRASQGQLVTISSVGGAVGQPFNEAYCAAKFAVEGFMESLAPVAATVGVAVTIVEPGPVATEFVNNVGVDLGALFAGAGPYEPALQAYITHVAADFSSEAVQAGGDVARVVLGVLRADAPPLRVQTSPWAEAFVGSKVRDLDGAAVIGETGTWVR
jgi:NAD(P)-dependent dehydrogenase (short-subunit alcohol dehydrogenase family)